MKGIVGLAARQSTAQPVGTRHSDHSAAGTHPTEADVSITTCWAEATTLQRIVCVVAFVVAITSPIFADVPVASAVTVALLVPVALIDIHTRRLPDVWIGTAAVVFLVADALDRAVGTTAVPPGHIVLGALIMGVPLLLMHLASPPSMGFGDVKLAVVLGAAIGATDWNLALPTLAIAAGVTATAGVIGRAKSIPFGPGLVGATLVALLAHDLLIRA